jgi:hypothetical protein
MGDIWFYVYAIPDHRDPRNRRGLVVRGIPDAVWVNMQGLIAPHQRHDTK